MSGYIINPMWFYWVDVLGGFDFAFGALAIFAVVGGIFFGALWLDSEYIEEEEKPKVIKVVKKWAVLTSILIILTILIPSKETMIQMQLAKFVTYENAEKVIETIQDATDYILEQLRGE